MPGFTTRPEIRGTFGVVATTHWLASAVGMSVLERDRPEGKKRALGVRAGKSLLPRSFIVEELQRPIDRVVDRPHTHRIPAETKPDVDGAHHGTEPRQIALLDQAKHAAKRSRMGLVDRFENGLAQALLALGSEEGFLHQFPAVGA